MKKILVIFGILLSVLINAQTLTVPSSLTQVNIADLSANMWEEFTNWTLSGQIIPVSTSGGVTTYNITTDWDPSNSQLNEIESAGGNTENWALYLTVNDSTFFTETINISNANTLKVLGRYTQPTREWGEYFSQSHEMYYYAAPNPDQYVILGAHYNGDIMTLSEVRDIVIGYTQCIGYRTINVVNGLKPSMIARSLW